MEKIGLQGGALPSKNEFVMLSRRKKEELGSDKWTTEVAAAFRKVLDGYGSNDGTYEESKGNK